MSVAAPSPPAASDLPREIDELTLRRAQRMDDQACRRLVVIYERRVFALLSRLLGPARRALVEDLAQETFLRVFAALPGFDPSRAPRPSTWILTIATRLGLDELRRRAPATAPLGEAHRLAGSAADAADAAAERRALGHAIARAVGALAPEMRAVFLLREYHGLAYDEIARALDVDLGTVKSRLNRARRALREALNEVHHG